MRERIAHRQQQFHAGAVVASSLGIQIRTALSVGVIRTALSVGVIRTALSVGVIRTALSIGRLSGGDR